VNGALVGVIVLMGLGIVVIAWYAAARVKTAGREIGQPDHVSEEVMTDVLAELRKWQAEAAHWKATAERLHRELDGLQ
jgi:hypothetical protein